MLLERRDIRGGSYAEAPSLEPQASLGEIFSASIDDMLYARNVDADAAAYEAAYDRRLDAIFAATGQRRDNPFRVGSGFAARNPGFADFKGGGSVDPHAAFQSWLEDLAEQQPQFRDVIKPDRPVLDDALDLQRKSVGAAADTYARGGRGAWLASVAGSFAGAAADPLNVAALLAGPFGEVGLGARAVLWNATKVGAINAGTEVVAYPFVRDWREKAGLEYSLGELAQNAGVAFLFGAGLDGGARSIYRGVTGLRGEPKPAPPQGAAADRALDAAAAALPADNVVRRAAEGDLGALREVAAATGQADDPAVRGALQAADLEDGLTVDAPLVDRGDGLSRLAQAIRSAVDDTEPAPGRADPVPPDRGPDLSNEAPLPKGEVGANQHARRFAVDGKPVAFREVDPAKIVADPATFQFKGGGDAAGATTRLSGVETWDPVAAGRAVVFERSSGELVIADGHQRLSLAKRLLAAGAEGEISLPAFVFREADGWSPGDVRALAAKKNLQEGSGTTIDAAKVIRDRPDIIDASVPLSSDAMRQARSLARLSDEAFGKVVAGVVPPNHAAMIGDLVPDKALHSGMVDELVAADPSNAREARFIVSELMQAPIQHEVQLTLLGAETMARPLLRERAKVLDAALKILRDDKRIFGMLEREAGRIERAGNALRRDANASAALEAETVSAVIEQLAANRGPVSDWLTEAARDIAGEAPVRKAAEAFAKRVRDALQKDGLAGLAAEPPTPLRANGFDDVTGPEAKAQVEALQSQFEDPKQGALFDELKEVKREGAIGVIVEGCKL